VERRRPHRLRIPFKFHSIQFRSVWMGGYYEAWVCVQVCTTIEQ
jgi:hypothetical protein